jgi:hypothetical protein
MRVENDLAEGLSRMRALSSTISDTSTWSEA